MTRQEKFQFFFYTVISYLEKKIENFFSPFMNSRLINMEFLKEPPAITLSGHSWGCLSHVELEGHGDRVRGMSANERDIYLDTNQENIKACFGISARDYEKWKLSLTYVGEVRLSVEHNIFGDTRHEDGSYYDSGLMPPPPPTGRLLREDQQPYWPLSAIYSPETIAGWVASGYINELLKIYQ